MSGPLIPNYKPGVGILTTDRFDFQKHVDGYSFHHNAPSINVSPAITIGASPVSNVYDAINALNTLISSFTIADATTSSKGLVQLSGDITGTATNVTVSGLRGRPVSNATPSNGQVLTWNSGSSAWVPTAPATFIASGDLVGTSSSQQVVGLTGTAGIVNVHGSKITFDPGVAPIINQTTVLAGNGNLFGIVGQSTTATSGNGGTVIISGGLGGASGVDGAAILRSGPAPLVEAKEVLPGNRVVSLAHVTGGVSSAEMPANTGDGVVYIRDAATAPTTGSPINGNILYSYGGALRVKQQDGQDFSIGTRANPDVWGPSDQRVYTFRMKATSTPGLPVAAFGFTMPFNMAALVDVTYVGKQVGGNNTLQTKITQGYVTDGVNISLVGTNTITDTRITPGATTWTDPAMNLVLPLDILVVTGFSPSVSVDWFLVIEIKFCS